MSKRAKPIFDQGRCKGCGLCRAYCPKNALGIEKNLNQLGYYPVQLTKPDLCTGCGRCAVMCPDIVIKVSVGGSA